MVSEAKAYFCSLPSCEWGVLKHTTTAVMRSSMAPEPLGKMAWGKWLRKVPAIRLVMFAAADATITPHTVYPHVVT